MWLGKLLVIFVDWCIFWQPLSLDFRGFRLGLLSLIFHLLSSHFYTCCRIIFPLALGFLVELLGVSTCFVIRLASCCHLLCLDISTSFLALAVNFLCGLIIFRMLGVYVDSSVMVIPTLWVHVSPLDFSAVKCTVILHSGISGRIIPLLNCRCSVDDVSSLFGVVAG